MDIYQLAVTNPESLPDDVHDCDHEELIQMDTCPREPYSTLERAKAQAEHDAEHCRRMCMDEEAERAGLTPIGQVLKWEEVANAGLGVQQWKLTLTDFDDFLAVVTCTQVDA